MSQLFNDLNSILRRQKKLSLSNQNSPDLVISNTHEKQIIDLMFDNLLSNPEFDPTIQGIPALIRTLKSASLIQTRRILACEKLKFRLSELFSEELDLVTCKKILNVLPKIQSKELILAILYYVKNKNKEIPMEELRDIINILHVKHAVKKEL